jgi:hypothetical protein
MSRAKRQLLISPLLLLLLHATPGHTQVAGSRVAATPILIELFTSEGCSSCPPADAWLQTLDSTQPIAGAQMIVLSEHVDYWNHDGWKDPYSSPFFTDRQSAYVRALGISSPYTPQVIVDGTNEVHLENQLQASQVLLTAAKAPQVPVSIGTVSVEGNSPTVLRAHIEADGTASKHSGDVYAAIALDHAESQVLHGENGGHRLKHVAVVQELVKIGKVEKGKTFTQDYQGKLKPGEDPKNLRLIVFVQEPGQGEVLGSALQEIRPQPNRESASR